MNISSFITKSIGFTVITSALVLVGQERTIASYGKPLSAAALEKLKDEYRQNLASGKVRIEKSLTSGGDLQERTSFNKAWKESGHEGAAWLGSWSADQGNALFNIYPSATKSNKVCIVLIIEGGVETQYSIGHVNRGAVYLDDGSLILSENGKLIHTRYPGPKFNQLVPFSQPLPKQYDRSSFPSAVRASRQQIDNSIESQSCTTELPSIQNVADDRSQLLPGETEAIRQFRATIRDFETTQKSIYVRDRRRDEEKSEIANFVSAWSKKDSQLAPFLGIWGGYEDQIHIYPSINMGKVCIVTTNETGTVLIGTGNVNRNRIFWTTPRFTFRDRTYPSSKKLLLREPRYLGAFSIENDQVKSNGNMDFPYSSPRPLRSMSDLLKNAESDRSEIIQKFESEGCTTDIPEGTIAKPTEQLQPIATKSNYAYPTAEEFEAFRKTVKSNNTVSGADRSTWDQYHQTWQSKNDTIAPYVGAWKTADNTLLYVYPSPQKGRFCVVTKENGTLSTGKGLGYRREARYNGDFGLFKIEGLADVVAMRSDAGQPLVPLYAAIDEPELSADLREELETLKCVVELPKGVTSLKPRFIRKPVSGDRVRESPNR